MANRKENKSRNVALVIIGFMIIIWTVLGVLSFTDREGYDRPMTTDIIFDGETALKGKQVFQSYNCMDCHTIVGNGAYFAPDLTNIYSDAGPAYLKAYLASPGTYPTESVVNIQLQDLIKKGEIKIGSLDEYYKAYPRAQERVVDRGGIEALMPNLQFTKQEISALIAFFQYTGKLNTAGWPPTVKAKESVIKAEKRKLEEKSGIIRNQSVSTAAHISSSEIDKNFSSGSKIANDMGCIACHSTDGSERIGPTWKNLYGTLITLTTGKQVKVDQHYLKRSILTPDEDIVEGYSEGVMPSYQGVFSDEELQQLIDYIKSLK